MATLVPSTHSATVTPANRADDPTHINVAQCGSPMSTPSRACIDRQNTTAFDSPSRPASGGIRDMDQAAGSPGEAPDQRPGYW
jgi:hypothetical protein